MKTVVYIRSSNIYDDSRATKEISALLESGYKVITLGWNRDGKAEKKCQDLFSAEKNNIDFRFFNIPVEGGIGIKNIRLLISWMLWIRRTVINDIGVNNIDAIHACNLDSALSIWKKLKKERVKLIYDIYDYYVDSHAIPSFLRNFVEKSEINIINEADITIICTEERKEQIKKAHPREVLVIHNSPDVDALCNTEEIYDYAYCGALFSGRLLKEVFDNYSKNSDLKFAIAGYGTYNKEAGELAADFNGFSFFGSVSYNKVLDIEREAKVISAIYEPNIRNHRLCAPNKFYEALALGKPVIVCRGTGIDKIVEKYNIGAVIDYSADDFYTAVRRFVQDDDMRKEIGVRARELYEREFRWHVMKERLISGYRRLIG